MEGPDTRNNLNFQEIEDREQINLAAERRKEWNIVRKGGSLQKAPENVSIPSLNENWMTMVPESNRQVLDFNLMQQNKTSFSKSPRGYLDVSDDDKNERDEPDLRATHEGKKLSLMEEHQLAMRKKAEEADASLKKRKREKEGEKAEEKSSHKKSKKDKESEQWAEKPRPGEKEKEKRHKDKKSKEKRHKDKKDKKKRKEKEERKRKEESAKSHAPPVSKYVPWDRERDLAADPNKFQKMISDSNNLNSRFTSAGYS